MATKNRPARLSGASIVAALALLLGACATTTTMEMEWRNPDFAAHRYQRIFVIGADAQDPGRRLFEDRFAAAIERQGSEAQASYLRLPESTKLDEARVRSAISGGGFDAVVVTRLLGVDEKQRYVAPQTYTVPAPYYGGWYGYYGMSYDVVHQPGYFVNYQVARLETNLYDVASAELVWSGRSDTLDPKNVQDLIDSMTSKVAKRLAADGLIGK